MVDITRKPKQDVAYAVAAGTFVNAIMALGMIVQTIMPQQVFIYFHSGLALNVALAFSMGNNLRAILNDSHGEPISAVKRFRITHPCSLIEISQMLLHAFGRKGTIAVYVFIILLQ